MRGLNSASLIRIVSNTPSRLRNTSSLVKRKTSNPSATSAAERAASRAISSFVECVAPSPPDHGPGVDDHPRLETDEVGDEPAEDNLAPATDNPRPVRAGGLARGGARRQSHYGGAFGQAESIDWAGRDPPPCPAPARAAGTRSTFRAACRMRAIAAAGMPTRRHTDTTTLPKWAPDSRCRYAC